MDCRKALEVLDCRGAGMFDIPAADLAAAEAHLADCRRCAAIARNRRDLDRRIGRILRAVEVPEAARQRTLTALGELDAQVAATGSKVPEVVATGLNEKPDQRIVAQRSAHSPERLDVLPARRRFVTRAWLPAAVCLVVGAIAFFGVVWLLTPRWSVDEVCQELAKVDFDLLQELPDFKGNAVAGQIPKDPGWQSLQWCCDGVAKGLPANARSHAFAVYGFAMRQGNSVVHGLLAVIPSQHMRAAPVADSLSTASIGDYHSARIGETVTAAWTSGDLVFVCMVQGGADSLQTLQQHLTAPPA
jgi:hypothetical protein